MSRNNLKINKISVIFVIIAIVAAGGFLLINLLNGKETYTSNNTSNTSMKSLYCIVANPTEAFFRYGDGEAEHKVKYIFDSNDEIDGVSYTYNGIFASNEMARQAEAQLHVDYNVYMAKIGIYQEDLSPTFIIKDNNLSINLFISRKTFTTGTAAFVFLTQKDIDGIDRYTIGNLKTLYEAKGFSCNINE